MSRSWRVSGAGGVGATTGGGAATGQIHCIEHPERQPVPVLAQTDGMVMARRAIPLTQQGEMVVTLVRPYELRG